MTTPCYLIEQTDRAKLSLRRFGFGPSEHDPKRHACPSREPWGSGHRPGCEAVTGYLETIPLVLTDEGYLKSAPEPLHDDSRWPSVCAHCGDPFTHDELWQANQEPIYRVVSVVPGAAVAVGEEYPLRDAPPGAIWEAKWLRDWALGFDGRGFICRLPDGHDWQIDSEANNCTRKGDRTHRCWIREGEPPFFNVTNNGPTCDAGAGSIQSPGYHGFLQNGVLT